MEPIVSIPDPDSFHHPTDLLVEDLHPRQVQDVELAAELDALLAGESAEQPPAPEEAVVPSDSLLPGFESLTWTHLAEARRLGDRLDTSEHPMVQHTILLTHGGASFGDHDPNASVSVQLEQDRIVLELTIDDIPHEAYLDPTEAAALQHILAQTLNNPEH